jgi:hypothetical protein
MCKAVVGRKSPHIKRGIAQSLFTSSFGTNNGEGYRFMEGIPHQISSPKYSLNFKEYFLQAYLKQTQMREYKLKKISFFMS